MAYAVIAGLPPIYGLYAGLVPLLIYPLLATSRHLATGPVAIDMLIVAAGVGLLADPGSDRYVQLVLLLTAMVGAIQVVMGLGRIGALVSLLARPVITGFAAAAGIIIALSQLGNLTGMATERTPYVVVLVADAVGRWDEIHLPTLVIGAVSIALLLAVKRLPVRIPGPLVVVVLATTAAWLLSLENAGVRTTGEVPSGLPAFALPRGSWVDLRDLLPTAVTLALVQFMSVSSLTKLFARRHRTSVDSNRELLAMGTANFAGSFFRALPVSGSFSRTSVNVDAGARTALANAAAALVVALTLLLFTPLFYHLPMAALGAIVVVSVLGLVDMTELRYLFRTKRADGLLALFTLTATLLVGIREGILLGIAASAAAVLFRLSRPHVAELGHLPGTRYFRDLDRAPEAVPMESLLLVRVDAAFSFFNADYIKRFILEKSETGDGEIRAVVLDGMGINDLDTTAVEALEQVVDALDERGIELHLTGLVGPVRDTIRHSGFYRTMGRRRFHATPHEAVLALLDAWDRKDELRRLEEYREQVDRRALSTPRRTDLD
ncbi:MAG: sulfate permease [Gemmatimonadales bacterium]|nr:MAG: sulfate permease [Gemmatimonadales bacterium]